MVEFHISESSLVWKCLLCRKKSMESYAMVDDA